MVHISQKNMVHMKRYIYNPVLIYLLNSKCLRKKTTQPTFEKLMRTKTFFKEKPKYQPNPNNNISFLLAPF
jgi:hypothetical protein